VQSQSRPSSRSLAPLVVFPALLVSFFAAVFVSFLIGFEVSFLAGAVVFFGAGFFGILFLIISSTQLKSVL
jgi:hypothetical protein